MFATGTETIQIDGQDVPLHFGDPAAEYALAGRGAVVIPRSHEGRLRAVGRDRLDLLHRMSTNDLQGMAPGEARPTVLTTAVARIVDLLWVLHRGEAALCLTGPGRAEAVRRWLAGYIFFRDQVKFEPVSDELEQVGLFGPRAGHVAEALLAGAGVLEPDRFLEADGVIVLRGRPLAGGGFSLIAPRERMPHIWQQALAAGAAPAGEQAYQWLRLAAGQPYAGHELTEAYIPLELDLWPAVSFRKGCYIGQEIIARMESRGKLARRLVGLRLEAPAAEGDEVRVEGAAAGQVTSAGQLPDLGPVALAVLKAGLAEPGQAVEVAGARGTVAALPFH